MKQCVTRLWVVVFELLLSYAGFAQGFRLEGMTSRSVPVTGAKMTNLVFPVALATGVKVSRDVLVQRPKGVDNVIELKAVRRNFTPTNLSVFGKDGQLYSFDLHFVEDTPVLSFRVVRGGDVSLVGSSPDTGLARVMLSGLPVDIATLAADGALLSGRRGFLHSAVRSGGVRLSLRGIWLRDGLLWFSFRVMNGTRIAFTPAYVRVFLEDSKKVKRTATQDLDQAPVYAGGLSVVPGRGSLRFAEAFAPFTVARGKRLVVQLADDAGGRSMMLVVGRKVVLKARE